MPLVQKGLHHETSRLPTDVFVDGDLGTSHSWCVHFLILHERTFVSAVEQTVSRDVPQKPKQVQRIRSASSLYLA